MKKRMLAAMAAVIVAVSANAQSTVDSIASKYKLLPMPGARTLEQAFPVLGNYQLANATEGTGTVTVSLDPSNKGIVWVEGLPQGKIKAYLKKPPTTYRILSQKSESGKQVQEGTLHYDTTSHELHVAFGRAYNEADPIAIFDSNSGMAASNNTDGETETNNTGVAGNQAKAKTKTATAKNKTKVQFYTATKVMPENTMLDASGTQQASDSTQQQ